MVKYNVWFKNFCIGKLYINEQGQHKYVVYMDAVEKAERDFEIFVDAKTDRDWGEPIHFFNIRIENCKRFGQVERVEYPNSEYCFIREDD